MKRKDTGINWSYLTDLLLFWNVKSQTLFFVIFETILLTEQRTTLIYIPMKKLIQSPLNLFVAGLILASSLTFVKCTKPDTEGQITFVRLNDGSAVTGASVKLFIDTRKSDAGFFLCNSNNIITPEKDYTTDASGSISECFDLPALINVYAVLTSTLPDTVGLDSTAKALIVANLSIIGEGKLNLIANEKTSITIKMSAN